LSSCVGRQHNRRPAPVTTSANGTRNGAKPVRPASIAQRAYPYVRNARTFDGISIALLAA